MFGWLRRFRPPKQTTLDDIIAGEIVNDEFYRAIRRYAASTEVKTILEIGSSAGSGSTRAFVDGINGSSSRAQLYCMEVSEPRFEELKNAYRHCDFVHAFNLSSVPLSAFPSEETVTHFYQAHHTNLNKYSLETILGWLRQDIAYITAHCKDVCGIKQIMQDEKLGGFDLVLIGGSEFTGRAELSEVIGAKVLMLDDINAYKNFENYQILKADPNYTLAEEDWGLRNGYAVFVSR